MSQMLSRSNKAHVRTRWCSGRKWMQTKKKGAPETDMGRGTKIGAGPPISALARRALTIFVWRAHGQPDGPGEGGSDGERAGNSASAEKRGGGRDGDRRATGKLGPEHSEVGERVAAQQDGCLMMVGKGGTWRWLSRRGLLAVVES
jgi:hypothetical protein